MPTTEGMVRPQGAVLDCTENRDILPDGLPYVDLGAQSGTLCNLLGVQRSVDETTLVDLLRKQKDAGAANVNADRCRRIYEYLGAHGAAATSALRTEALIFVPGGEGGPVWRAAGEIIWEDRRDLFGASFGYLKPHYGNPPVLKPFFCTTLGVAEDVTVGSCLDWLTRASASQSTDAERTAKVYKLLADRHSADPIRPADEPRCRKAFAEEDLIYDPHANRWLTSQLCVWPDRRAVLGDQFAYLERHYPSLKGFFVELLGVKMEVDDKCYADRWRALQEQESNPDPNELDQALSAIYTALLRVVVEQSGKVPDWWEDFARHALVVCEDGRFHKPGQCLIPDDGELRRILTDTGHTAAFAYLPNKRPWKEWDPLLSRLEVRRVSAAVHRQGASATGARPAETPGFLTSPTVQLVLAWLHSEKRLDCSDIREVRSGLRETREVHAESLEVSFAVDGSDIPVRTAYPAYWDRQSSPPVLFLADGARRLHVANALFAGLMGRLGLDHDDSDQDDCGVLAAMLGSEEADAIAWMEKRGWRLPDDEGADGGTPASGGGADVGEVDATEPAGKPETTEAKSPGDAVVPPPPGKMPPRPRGHAPPVGPRPPVDVEPGVPLPPYSEMLSDAFSRPARLSAGADDDGPMLDDAGPVRKHDRRAAKLLEGHQARMAEEPDSAERRMATELTILEASDPAVRQRLFEWYRGKCQICGLSWPKRDGTPFFLAAYLVERQNARWLDDAANAICLCAEHFAQWRHAAKEDPLGIAEQVRSMHLPSQGGTDDLCILFTMLGQTVQITYCEKHMLALKTFIGEAREPTPDQRR